MQLLHLLLNYFGVLFYLLSCKLISCNRLNSETLKVKSQTGVNVWLLRNSVPLIGSRLVMAPFSFPSTKPTLTVFRHALATCATCGNKTNPCLPSCSSERVCAWFPMHSLESSSPQSHRLLTSFLYWSSLTTISSTTWPLCDTAVQCEQHAGNRHTTNSTQAQQQESMKSRGIRGRDYGLRVWETI